MRRTPLYFQSVKHFTEQLHAFAYFAYKYKLIGRVRAGCVARAHFERRNCKQRLI